MKPWTPEDDREVIRLRSRGWTNPEIADVLGRSAQTVHNRARFLGLVDRPTTCARCGEPIEQKQTGRPRRYCSRACAEFQGPRVYTKTCVECGVEFTAHSVRVICCPAHRAKRLAHRRSYERGTSGGLHRKRMLGLQ